MPLPHIIGVKNAVLQILKGIALTTSLYFCDYFHTADNFNSCIHSIISLLLSWKRLIDSIQILRNTWEMDSIFIWKAGFSDEMTGNVSETRLNWTKPVKMKTDIIVHINSYQRHLGFLLLTWLNFNLSMVGWNHLSIPPTSAVQPLRFGKDT